MALKVYKANLRLTVPIVTEGKVRRYVSFQDENCTFSTSDEEVQRALEGLALFGKVFKLVRTVGGNAGSGSPLPSGKEENGERAEREDEKAGGEVRVFGEVADWQEAKDVLRGEPYGVPYQALGSPEAILKKAEELRVSFPRLKPV